MLASRFGVTALPDTMADDTMEISSEHGHNVGDEDIDIDIDFTAGHVDEDDVLEDATSNIGFGDDFPPQSSPAVGNDDIMVDEDDESYPMPMDGADVMRDDDPHNMEDEIAATPFIPANIPTVLVEENHSSGISNLADGPMKDEVSWEVNDESESSGNAGNVHSEAPEAGAHEINHDGGDFQDSTDIGEAVTATSSAPHEEFHPSTPSNTSPKVDDPVGAEPRSASASISAREAKSQDNVEDRPNESPDISSTSEDVADAIENTTNEETVSIPSLHEVIVAYQDSEYSLFSKSETDDIDSYFLSDISIMDQPLCNFFEAIRGVIRDDLSNEDELCVSVEDLGLEIVETSSMTGSITIGQIINLHEKLLQNDGVESVRPLYLQLGTRPNFSVRFANLISGALEGKGLSELVQWEEQSESFDNSAHVTENEHGEELSGESYEADEGLGDTVEKEQSKVQEQQSSDDILTQDSRTEQVPREEAGNTLSEEIPATAASNGTHPNHNTHDSEAQPTVTEEIVPLQKNEAPDSGEYDEDGDLIDYSDVDDDARPQLRNDAIPSPSKLGTDDNGSHNDYQAINEELHRRSISRAAEDSLLAQATETSVGNESEGRDQETNVEAENGIEYDEDDGEDFEHGDIFPEHDDPPADFGEDHEDGFYLEDGDVEGDELADGHDLILEPTNEGGQGTFDEFDFGEDEDTQQHKQSPIPTDHETQTHDDDEAPIAERNASPSKDTFPIGSSLGLTDVRDSDSTTSEKTLEAQPTSVNGQVTELNEENDDEIDYDDDETDALDVQEPKAEEHQVPNNGSGKRQRVDDDDTSAEGKEAKRPRS